MKITSTLMALTLAGSALAGTNVPLSFVPRGIAVQDFNGDGFLDVAVIDGHSTLAMLLGTGDGKFGTAINSNYSSQFPLCSAFYADFNGDSKLDILVPDAHVPSTGAQLYLGDGTGAFPSMVDLALPGTVLAVGDLNKNKKTDLVCAQTTGNTITVALNDGNSQFTTLTPVTVGQNPIAAAIADFNGDGYLDIAVQLQHGSLLVLLGDGTGSFTTTKTSNLSFLSLKAVDINNDGYPDLVNVSLGGTNGQNTSYAIGKGDGTFSTATNVSFNEYYENIGDFNGDGILDFAGINVASGATVDTILASAGPNYSNPAVSFTGSSFPNCMAVGDLNNDKLTDVVVGDALNQQFTVLLSTQNIAPPVPAVVSAISPARAMAGGFGGTMTITGSNFTAQSIVQWNNTQTLPTTFVSPSTLTVNIPATCISNAGLMNVCVCSTTTKSNNVSFTIFDPTGIVGSQGPAGVPGKNGIDGKPGIQGLQGLAGKDGKDGKNGADGKPGVKGDQGPCGKTGPAGPGYTPVTRWPWPNSYTIFGRPTDY